jgi:sugar transferase (PEP-CTERM/EpsH1 system associated)
MLFPHSASFISSTPVPVVHVVTSLGMGGLEKVVLDLTRGLNRAIFKPSVLCLHERGPLASQFEAAGVPVAALDCGQVPRWRMVIRLARRLRLLRPPIVHTHNPIPHIYGTAAARLAGVPFLVHTKHGRNRPEWPRQVLLNRLASYLSNRVVPVSADAAEVARRIERVPRRKLLIIHNGVDMTVFRPAPGPGLVLRHVIHAARLNLIKDQKTLLRAARLAADAAPDFRLELIGDGPEREALHALRDELGLQAQVIFLGERDDIPERLQQASLFVLSSLGEGLSLTLLEAMACGLPVVATRVGGNPEVVVHGTTGLLVPPESPSALAEAMLSLWRDPGTARRMGQAGRRRIEAEFDLKRVVARYEALYLSLMSGER